MILNKEKKTKLRKAENKFEKKLKLKIEELMEKSKDKLKQNN